MSKTTKFTHIRFLSLIRVPIDQISLALEMLEPVGFKQDDSALVQQGILLIYRDILFSKKDIEQDILAMEQRVLQEIFIQKQLPVEWMATWIKNNGIFNISNNDVQYEGRTVCIEIYPKLIAYVE